MSLLTIVKAGNITNLSNARYCAGMGVEIIGFPIEKGSSSSLEISKIKEITGWLSGIKIAVEFMGKDYDKEYVSEIIKELSPDYIQIPLESLEEFRKITSIPFLLWTTKIPEAFAIKQEDYVLFSGKISVMDEALLSFCKNHNTFLSCSETDRSTVLEIIKTIHPYGIELKGSNEISPGLKSFDELSEILEILEVEE
jgi:phosphoribosylanthranilate isomerase